MITDTRQVHETHLPPRQRKFLEKLRQHDQKVVVLRDGDGTKLRFLGPVIGEGPMPQEGPDGDTPGHDGALRFGGKDWSGIKRRLGNRYAQLTDGDLAYVPGEEEELMGRILTRTQETRTNLEKFLREECGCAL
jgi:hypothetical protein